MSSIANKTMTIFSFLNAVLIFAMGGILLVAFFVMMTAYVKVRKQIAKDQQRIQNGETVLFQESFVYQLLGYANTDYRKEPNKEDSLKIYSVLGYAKGAFAATQLLITLTLLAVVLYMFFVIFTSGSTTEVGATGEESEGIKAIMIRMIVPIVMALAISAIMIGYVKGIYDAKYVSVVLPDINEIYSRINDSDGIKSMFSRNMASKVGDAGFYDWLKTETVERIKERLLSDSPSNSVLVKRIITLSIHDYFKNELPNYDNSPVRFLFDANTQDFDKYNPMDYIRLDCSRVIENYAYKYDITFGNSINPDTKLKILNDASTAIEAINEKISKIRIDIQPTLLYLENFFRVGFLYLFLMALIVVLIILRYYGLHEYIIAGFVLAKGFVYGGIAKVLSWFGYNWNYMHLLPIQKNAVGAIADPKEKLSAVQGFKQLNLLNKRQAELGQSAQMTEQKRAELTEKAQSVLGTLPESIQNIPILQQITNRL